MTNIRKCCVWCIGVWFCCAAVDAGEEKKQIPAGQIHQKIYELNGQIELLEQKREDLLRESEKAEQLAERQKEFDEIRSSSREYVAEHDERLADLMAEETETRAQDAFRAVLKKHLGEVLGVHNEILALNDVSQLSRAHKMRRKLEVIETEWWMITEPTYMFPVRMQEMKEYATEEGSQEHRNILKQLADLHDEDMADRKKEIELSKKRMKKNDERERLFEAFWRDE